ncbi:MAG: aldo/keto reductase [Oscillospiraceae bacterium]|nr:aldo/keto reductase [Oscillospiraceae bacterium]
MEKRPFKGEHMDVSLLGLGMMRLPRLDPENDAIDYAKAQEIVDYAYEHGVNYFDTAYRYHGGDSELFAGVALKKYPRDSFYLATKMPMWMVNEPADVERIFKDQLERCQVEYFDFYLCHALGDDTFKKVQEMKAYDFLKKMKEEGKIRHLGFSFHDKPEVLQHIVDTYEWDFCQIQLNYLDWTLYHSKEQYEILEKAGIPVIIMEPVRGGFLANPGEEATAKFKAARPEESVASWAIRYAATLPGVMTVLSGMSNMEQVADNVKTMTDFEPVDAADQTVIDDVVDNCLKKDFVPCTGCRYCMDCPFGVDIPKMFSIYNNYALTKNAARFVKAYNETAESERVHNCQKCGACSAVCPQHIDIPAELEMIGELVEKLSK